MIRGRPKPVLLVVAALLVLGVAILALRDASVDAPEDAGAPPVAAPHAPDAGAPSPDRTAPDAGPTPEPEPAGSAVIRAPLVDAPAPGPASAPEPGTRLVGRVVDETGAGLAGANVELLGDGGALIAVRSPLGRTTTTDGRGWYAFDAPPAGIALSVRARVAGLAPGTLDGLRPRAGAETQAPDLTLLRGLVLRGRVGSAQDGGAVPGARIEVAESFRMAPGAARIEGENRAVFAGPDGRYEIPGLLPDEYRLTASADGFATLTLTRSFFAARNRADVEIDFALVRADRRVRGKVVDPDGRPLAADLVARSKAPAPPHDVGCSSAADGTFELPPLTAAAYDLEASAPHHVLPAPFEIASDARDVRLVLVPKGIIRGVVRRADGLAAGVVRVDVMRLDPRSRWPRPGPAARMDGARFEAADLEPGEYVLEAWGVDAAPTRSEVLALAPGQTIADVTLLLDPGGRVTGRVVDAAGAPSAGARVAVLPADYDPESAIATVLELEGRDGRTATCDASGRFRIDGLRPGAFALRVVGANGAAALARGLFVESGKAVDAGSVVLPAARALEGVVLDPDGRPAARVLVTAVATASGVAGRAYTDAAGRFSIPAVPLGDLRVTALLDAYPAALRRRATAEFTLEAGAANGVTLRLEAP